MGLSDFVYDFGYDYVYEKSPIFLQNILCSTYGYLEKRKRFSNHFFTYLNWLEQSQY